MHKQKRRHFHAKTTVHWRSTHGAGNIPPEILRFRSVIYRRCGHFYNDWPFSNLWAWSGVIFSQYFIFTLQNLQSSANLWCLLFKKNTLKTLFCGRIKRWIKICWTFRVYFEHLSIKVLQNLKVKRNRILEMRTPIKARSLLYGKCSNLIISPN